MTCGGREGQKTTSGFQEMQFREAAAMQAHLPATRCCRKVLEENEGLATLPPFSLTGLPLRGRF